MKSCISIKLFLFLFFLVYGAVSIQAADQVVIPQNNTQVFVKYDAAWFYNDGGDCGKDFKNVKNKTLLYFGNKATVIGNKKSGDTVYLNILLPDDSKCWGPMDYLVTKFIVITDKDIKTYTQPDESYINKVKLQPGYLGYLIKEKGNFLNVDFYFYAPKKAGDNPVWIGNVWIKTPNYTDDIIAAKQANALRKAFNELYGKSSNKANAIKFLKEGLDSTADSETPIIEVLKNLISELEGSGGTQSSSSASPEKVVGAYYSPSTDGLRFRETPSIDGKFIRTLQKGEKLKLVEKGDEETINDVKGRWGKFEDSDGNTGWCFDAYLDEVK